MKKNNLKVLAPAQKAVLVFRTRTGTPDTLTGSNLTFTVIHESLIILSDGVAAYVYGPGQWVTVNANPV
jgi:hypothetical protein